MTPEPTTDDGPRTIINEPDDIWVQTPIALICDQRLSSTATRIYSVLRYHGATPDRCYPGHGRLAAYLGISERTIARPLKQLEETGWIERHKRFRVDGSRTSDAYFVRSFNPTAPALGWESTSARFSAEEDGPIGAPPRDSARDHRAEKRGELDQEELDQVGKENSLPTPAAPTSVSNDLALFAAPPAPAVDPDAELEAEFLEFWKAYPSSKDKKAARNKYKTARKTMSHEFLLAAALRWADWHAKDGTEPRWIASAERWFNTDRFDQDPYVTMGDPRAGKKTTAETRLEAAYAAADDSDGQPGIFGSAEPPAAQSAPILEILEANPTEEGWFQ